MPFKFHSTRGGCPPVSLADALSAGLAPDGGLYVPTRFPRLNPSHFDGATELADIANRALTPWFEGDELEPELDNICREALTFPVPVTGGDPGPKSAGTNYLPIRPPIHPLQRRCSSVAYHRYAPFSRLAGAAPQCPRCWQDNLRQPPKLLELFHGPSAAFKDVGARFLAASLTRLERVRRDGLTILVATSGDTGGAVAAAFEGVAGVGVAILFPGGMVSPRQEHQLCCWEAPIVSLRVGRDFDACQALVKGAFGDAELKSSLRLSSANSISIGRLLPQTVYYAASSLAWWRDTGRPASYVIPTGNLGNALACVWARHMGLPIDRIVLATNQNRAVPNYLRTGSWAPGQTVQTLASAMDVGDPSNMERLRHLLPDVEQLRGVVSAHTVSDEEIRQNIAWAWQHHGLAVCPHTATAVAAWRALQKDPASNSPDWITVATAHPAKFEGIVEPIIGQTVPVPENLAALLERPVRAVDMEPDAAVFAKVLSERFG
jgi:threonine synthase